MIVNRKVVNKHSMSKTLRIRRTKLTFLLKTKLKFFNSEHANMPNPEQQVTNFDKKKVSFVCVLNAKLFIKICTF